MQDEQDIFPQKAQLWRGAILHTIAHAIWIASDPSLANILSWDGFNYNRQDDLGSRGTVTFMEDYVVGVFFDEHSARNPYHRGDAYDMQPFFKGMPPNLLTIANEHALQYVVDDYKGETVPVITASFWSNGEYLTAAEPWQGVLTNGAHLVSTEIMETDDALAEWQIEYEFSAPQVALVQRLYQKRLAAETSVILNGQDRDEITTDGDEGIDEARELLVAVGIMMN